MGTLGRSLGLNYGVNFESPPRSSEAPARRRVTFATPSSVLGFPGGSPTGVPTMRNLDGADDGQAFSLDDEDDDDVSDDGSSGQHADGASGGGVAGFGNDGDDDDGALARLLARGGDLSLASQRVGAELMRAARRPTLALDEAVASNRRAHNDQGENGGPSTSSYPSTRPDRWVYETDFDAVAPGQGFPLASPTTHASGGGVNGTRSQSDAMAMATLSRKQQYVRRLVKKAIKKQRFR